MTIYWNCFQIKIHLCWETSSILNISFHFVNILSLNSSCLQCSWECCCVGWIVNPMNVKLKVLLIALQQIVLHFSYKICRNGTVLNVSKVEYLKSQLYSSKTNPFILFRAVGNVCNSWAYRILRNLNLKKDSGRFQTN